MIEIKEESAAFLTKRENNEPVIVFENEEISEA